MSGSIQIVFETHSCSEDNDRGIATGWNAGRLSDKGRELWTWRSTASRWTP